MHEYMHDYPSNKRLERSRELEGPLEGTDVSLREAVPEVTVMEQRSSTASSEVHKVQQQVQRWA